MYSVDYTNEFRRQAKLMQKRGRNMELLNTAIKILNTNPRGTTTI